MLKVNFDSTSGLYRWTKGTDEKLSNHFTTHEFTCPCTHAECREQMVHFDLIEHLEDLRATIAAPMRITSGYRCSRYQADLRARGYETAAGTSQHELGRAADFQSLPRTGPELETVAAKQFKAIGVASMWVHVDLRNDKTRRWSYVR